MFYFSLFDNNKKLINKVSTDDLNYVFNDSESIDGINLSSHYSLFNNIDSSENFGISVLIPIDGGEDFVFQHVGSAFLSFLDNPQEKVFGKSYKKSFPLFVELGLFDFYKKSYKLNTPLHGTVNIYNDTNLLSSFKFKIFSEVDHVYIFSNDITELALIEEQFNSLFEDSVEGVILVDKNGKILKLNSAFSKITGYSCDELEGVGKYFDIISEINNKKMESKDYLKIMNDLLSYKLPNRESKVKIIHKDGTYKWIKTYAIKSRFEGFVRISCMDITENKLMEDELLKLKSNFDIIQNMAEIIVIDRLDGVFNWSYEFYNIFGREISKKESSTSHDLIYECILDNKKEYLNKIIKASENKEIFTFVFPFETEDFIIKYFKVWINFKYPHFAYETSFVGFIQDVSDEIKDKLQLENKLIENTSLLEELNQSLKDKKQLIIEKDQLLNDKSVLLKEVHHRVKNNLQIILSMLKIDYKRGENPKDLLDLAINQIKAISLIHEKIYRSSDIAHVNIKDYIFSAIDSLFELYSMENITLNYDIDDIEIDLDIATPLGLILNELLNNAVKYAFPNGEKGNLYISLKINGNDVALTFGDDGVGLPEDLDIENSNSIGLMVIKNLVYQIDGEITILNTDGTVYEIKFPLFNEF